MEALAKRYLATREVSVAYSKNILRTAKRASDWGMRADTVSAEQVNTFLASMSSVSAASRANMRRELLTVWRFGYEEGLCPAPPLRVMRIKVNRPPVQAWSLDELRKMMEAAENDKTNIGGKISVRVCDYLPHWIGIAYDTGLRHSDMLSLHSREIRNGNIYKIAAKTGKQLARKLSPKSAERASELIASSPDGTLFAWFLTRRRSFIAFREFLNRHGFDGDGRWLRRSCATYIAQESKAQASRYLQHSSENLLRHYVDESLLDCPPGPPPIS